jgi:hypothetical protein
MSDLHEGGCLCGAIRYRFAAAPLATAVCHCTNCRKQGGGAYSVNVVIPAAAFEQTGETKVFTDRGDSGNAVWRHFCPACGSPIVSLLEAAPPITIVKAGTLDRPDAFTPDSEVFCDSALAWVQPIAERRATRAG